MRSNSVVSTTPLVPSANPPEAPDESRLLRSAARLAGQSQDNAVAESFWANPKRELVHRCRFSSGADARGALIAWINHYNAVRLHSILGTCRRSNGSYASRSVNSKPRGNVPG